MSQSDINWRNSGSSEISNQNQLVNITLALQQELHQNETAASLGTNLRNLSINNTQTGNTILFTSILDESKRQSGGDKLWKFKSFITIVTFYLLLLNSFW